MTTTAINWNPFDADIWENPYPIYRRMRAEAPVYYNEEHDFYAFSRFDDVERGLSDWETFSSARGNIYEFIKAGFDMPPGTVIMEDPPTHDINRGILVRAFTPRRVAALEPMIREFIARQLDPLADAKSFDLIDVLSDKVPMRVIGMLLGIPEEDQQAVRDKTIANLKTEEDGKMDAAQAAIMDGAMFAEFIDWRKDNPGDDLITELLTKEFEDVDGVTRTLTREEVLTYLTVVAGAGNETTGQLMGWIAKIMAEYPEVYAELVADRSLIPNAIEEVLRLEPIGQAVGRYVAKDVEFHGQVIPAGSTALFILAAASRDESKYENSEQFDIRRKVTQQRAFGVGGHYCLGASLARLEGRLMLDEMCTRFPNGWDIDWSVAKLASTSTVRGWETLPLLMK